ncbi:meiosis-specific nuclear structural protein 1-like isoform X2 [Mytilus trossulus]|uniref:meiosis-specific nuclear structural protein 1-like isoform X2 n=1 Tax=Mytilus trossulus TaxID=6551 RepID=UPI003006B9FD
MADNFPRSSTTAEKFEVIEGRNILEKLRDGNLNLVTASRKRRKISVKYHNEDIEECYHKVRRLSNNPTVTDLENSLDETQGELEDEIIRLEDRQKNLHQCFESEKQHGNEVLFRVIQSKNEDMIRYLQEKDEESARKDEIIKRLQGENNRNKEENNRKEEIIRRLEEENNRNKEQNNWNKKENIRSKEIIRRLIEENNRKKETIRRFED